MTEIVNLQGVPLSLDEFKHVFNRLLEGGEPQDEREKVIHDGMAVAMNNVSDFGTPVEGILTSWYAFMSTRRWLAAHTTPQGEALLAKTDKMLAQVVVNLLWESWKLLEGVDEINGEGEINAGAHNEESGGGEGTVSAVPSPESGPAH